MADTDPSGKPIAEKLTINIDSVSQRLPPQIAYFIPNREYHRNVHSNGTIKKGKGKLKIHRNGPPMINMWPPNFSRNQSFSSNHSFSNSTYSSKKSHRGTNITDLVMSQQQPHRYIAVQKTHDDPATAYQNFNYQIDFGEIPDKQPDFKRLESFVRERNQRVKPKKYIKRPVSINYASTHPNLRNRLKFIKIEHENKFDVSNNESNDESSDQSKIPNKVRKTRRKKPHYSTFKLSHPTSVENESSFSSDRAHADDNNESKHQNWDNPNSESTDAHASGNDDGSEESGDKVKNPYAIYLTKIVKHPKPQRSDKRKSAADGFVPTRIMSSVRGVTKIVHKERKVNQPTMRERLRESGGHVVYTEDGYEDKHYDHGVDDKSLEYLSRSKRSADEKRQSTNVKELKGQQLLDHLDSLIRNVSDYLNSSEIIPDTNKKYPLYETTEETIEESPIKYSEYAKPVVEEDNSSELYESKTKTCEEIYEEIDLSNAHNETNGSKKRLGNLGNKLDCFKEKLFGEEPLDNPLFQEDKVSQPQLDNIFTHINKETENLQAISSVYSDVMDNIKYNSINENQRIFSDFGISDNFASGSINTHSAAAKPDNELNTDEKYPEDFKENKKKEQAKVTKSPLILFNPYTDPAQLPILDISRYIPTPKYEQTDSDYALQTDFKPIVSPYRYESHSTSTTPPTTQPYPKYGPVRKLPPRNHPYPFNTNHQNYRNNPNVQRNPAQNIVLYKHRRPIAVVRVVPKNLPLQRA